MPERYTRGFPFDLGPMEQCASGEWMRVDEVQKELDEIEGEIDSLRRSVRRKESVINSLTKDCTSKINEIRKLEVSQEYSWFVCVLAYAAGLGIGLLVGFVL